MFGAPAKTDYDQARELLEHHRRMTVGAALERPVIGDAIAELAFSGRTDWTYEEARARLESLQASSMPVGQWLGRHHSGRQQS